MQLLSKICICREDQDTVESAGNVMAVRHLRDPVLFLRVQPNISQVLFSVEKSAN